jgi:integrase
MSPRKATGIYEERAWKDGETVTYGARVRYRGGQVRLNFGTNKQGWSEQRARNEIEKIVGQIERGTWTPPDTERAQPVVVARDGEFLTFLYKWWQAKKLELTPRGRDDYLWRIGKLKDGGLGTCKIVEIDKRAVDEERTRLLTDGLAPRSVNMVLMLLAQVLDAAVDYELLDANPARGRNRRVKEQPVRRGWLLPEQAWAMIEAAGDLEREARPSDRFGRRALVATLLLAGPRVNELIQANRSNLDLHAGLIKVGSKTEAGMDRTVDLSWTLASELRAWVASRDLPAEGPLFPTRTGKRHSASNVRRLLRKCAERAGVTPVPTPHSCRRTFATLCFFAGRDPRQVMAWLGHSDPRMTLAVYAQTLSRSRVDRELVWRLMRFSDEQETTNERPVRSVHSERLGGRGSVHEDGRRDPQAGGTAGRVRDSE